MKSTLIILIIICLFNYNVNGQITFEYVKLEKDKPFRLLNDLVQFKEYQYGGGSMVYSEKGKKLAVSFFKKEGTYLVCYHEIIKSGTNYVLNKSLDIIKIKGINSSKHRFKFGDFCTFDLKPSKAFGVVNIEPQIKDTRFNHDMMAYKTTIAAWELNEEKSAIIQVENNRVVCFNEGGSGD